ncbi:MAG: DUF3999 domain-containing protein [Zoogloeaceae bacterium]|jgi:hypothetical protein|nr:DUF3999 domain-containing protein [Zoogloeaceae bacterium]
MKHCAGWKFASLLVIFALSLPVQAAENPDDYPYKIVLQTQGQARWYRLDIPMSVQWSAAHADLRDLRVFNAAGEALPYALTAGAARHTETRREAAARLFPLYAEADAPVTNTADLSIRRDAEGMVIEILPDADSPAKAQRQLRGWLLDTGAADFPLERLDLDWRDAKEGFQRFSIEASDDLEHWRYWGKGQVARLNFNGEAIEQNEIRLPGHKARYLRLLWLAAPEAATVNAARLVGTLAGEEAAPLVWSETLPGERVGEGEFIWRLPLALPLTRLRIRVLEDNTLAPVVISGRFQKATAEKTPDDNRRGAGINRLLDRASARRPAAPRTRETPWRPLARGVAYRLTEADGERVQDEFDLPAQPVNQLRLQFDLRGGGLGGDAAPEARVALHGHQLVFLARGSAPYQLAFGRADAPPAALPLATLIPPDNDNDSSRRFGVARLTDALPASITPAPAPEETVDWKKVGLWLVLLAGVALLLGMAFSLLRAASAADQTEDDQAK